VKDPGYVLVEIQTPIRSKSADQRSSFADLLPRVLRRKVIRRNLSGTDKSLLVVAWYLQREGLKVLVATRDRELMEACRELGIKASLPEDAREDWVEDRRPGRQRGKVKEGGRGGDLRTNLPVKFSTSLSQDWEKLAKSLMDTMGNLNIENLAKTEWIDGTSWRP